MSKLISARAVKTLFFVVLSIQSFGQSFFTGQILSSSPDYGNVSTRLLPEDVSGLVKNRSLTFDQWSAFFYLKTSPSSPPVAGSYQLNEGQITFRPTQPPNPELKYIVGFSYPNLSKLLDEPLPSAAVYNDVISFQAPESDQPAVENVLPSLDDKTPANVLRLYVSFTAPMGNQNPYDFILIKDQQGNILEAPFVIIPEGLWNIDKTRLTLLFNPGQSTDVLLPGKTYTLEVSSNWKGESGKPLRERFTRSFTTAAPIKEAINVNRWALSATQDRLGVLTVITDHPLDQPLAQRMLYIQGPDGGLLPTRVEFLDRKRLRILWAAQEAESLFLVIDPRLEDVCGNTPLAAFDLESSQPQARQEEIKLRFKINP